MKRYFEIGNYKGAPVLLHRSLLIALPLLFLFYSDISWITRLAKALNCLALYLLLILAHELGHAYVAHKRGLRVMAINIYPFHGICLHEAAHYEIDAILVAWAGVAAQTMLFLAACAATVFLPFVPDGLRPYVNTALTIFIPVNLMTLLQNLLPVKPLDGKIAWRAVPFLFSKLKYQFRKTTSQRKPRPTASKNSQADAERIANDEIRRIMSKDKQH